MSLPTQSNNLVGSQVFCATDLGLSGNLASGASTDGTGFSTGIPATVLVCATASAGGASVLKLKVGSTAAIDMTSGTTNATVPAGGSNFVTINTTTANPFVRLRLTDSANSSSYSQLFMFVLYGLTAGENGIDVRTGYNACASTKIGDGGGVLNLANR